MCDCFCTGKFTRGNPPPERAQWLLISAGQVAASKNKHYPVIVHCYKGLN